MCPLIKSRIASDFVQSRRDEPHSELAVAENVVSYRRWLSWRANWATESSDGTTRLYAADEQTPDTEGHPGTSLVLEGTQQEVDGYIANYVVKGRNYLIPGLLIG